MRFQDATYLPHKWRTNGADSRQTAICFCEVYVSDDGLKHFRTALKDAADGNWKELSKNPFYQSRFASKVSTTEKIVGDWKGERAFFTFLEKRCLALIHQSIIGASPSERLIDACRLYAQAFLGEYISAARLEQRLTGASPLNSKSIADTFVDQLLGQITEKGPEMREVNREDLVRELRGPVSRDTFERSVRRALHRLLDAFNEESSSNSRTTASGSQTIEAPEKIQIGSLALSIEERDLWRRVSAAMREQCSTWDTAYGRLPIETAIARHGILLTSDEHRPAPIEEAIQKYPRVLVSAPLGGGLSTLAARLTKALSVDETLLTILISLASHGAAIAEQGLLHTFAHNVWGKSRPQEAPLLEQLLLKAASNSALNIILDDWDEMTTDAIAIREELSRFQRYVCFCHTPSPAQYQPIHDAQLALMDLTHEEIAAWLHALMKITDGKFSEDQAVLALNLLTHDVMAEMKGGEPLYLAIALRLTYDRFNPVPIAEMLWNVVDHSLSKVRLSEGETSTTRHAIREWLAQLAFWMLWGTAPVVKLRKDASVWQIPSSLLEPPLLSGQLASHASIPLTRRRDFALHSGILKERENGTYAFASRWLQRILAAEAIARQPGFCLELTEVQDRPVLLLAAWVSAQTHGRAAALQEVIGNYRNPREHTHLDWMLFLAELLAQFATGNVQTHWAQTTRSVLELKLLSVLRACPFVGEQQLISRALAALGSQEALAYCQACLAGQLDLYPAERTVLIQQLKWFAHRDAALALASEATRSGNPDDIRAEAIQALCQIPCADGIGILRDLMTTATDAQQTWLVRILGMMHQPMARFLLLTIGDEVIPEARTESRAQMAHGYIPVRFEPWEARDVPLIPSTDAAWQAKNNLTDLRLIEQLIGSATASNVDERHAAAYLLNCVPPLLDEHSELNRQIALRLLQMVESETDAESRWAAYRLLKLGAPSEIFGDLIRVLEREEVRSRFTARAVIDILASRRFLCQVLESRSVSRGARLLLMLRFGFHMGVDYSALDQGRAVFLLRDGREVRTCAELNTSLDSLND